MTIKAYTVPNLPCPVCGNECRADIVLRYEESRQAAAPTQGREALARIIDPDAKWGAVLETGSDANNQILLALEKADAIRALIPAVAPDGAGEALDQIVGHLGAALVQSSSADDQIIMDHVRVAHELAKTIRRRA